MKRAKVSETLIKMVFFRVRTGTESDVVKDLQEKLKLAGIKKSKVFKVFGAYDLLLIHENTGSLLLQGVIPNVISSSVVDCFAWQSKDQTNTMQDNFSFDHITEPLLGVMFLKMKPNFLRVLKDKLELGFSSIVAFDHGSTLGSFGWSDAIVLVPGHSIIDLMRKMNRTDELYYAKGDSIERLVLKTYSFLSIDFDICQDLLCNQQQYTTTINEDPMDEVSATLEISCRPESLKEMIEESKRIFKNTPVLSIGKGDIVLTPKIATWIEFLKILLTFRKNFKDKLISTRVHIYDCKIQSRKTQRKLKSTTPKTFTLIDQINNALPIIPEDDFARMLLGNLYLLHHCAQNELIADDIQALIPFATHFLENYLGKFELIELTKIVQLFETSLNQRLAGAYVGTEELRSGFNYRQGGLQKVLSATEVTVHSLFKCIKMQWKGFVVIGSAPDYRHDLDIINIPHKVWSDPSLWWGLFHETGHVFALQHPDFAIVESFAKKSLSPPLPEKISTDTLNAEDLNSFDTSLRFLHEVVADAFDYRFGFLAQKNYYLRTIWSYLISDHNDKIQAHIRNYLQRSVCALLINDIEKANEVTHKRISVTMKKVMSISEILGVPNTLLKTIDRQLFIENIFRLADFLEHTAKALKSQNFLFAQLQTEWKSREFRSIAQHVRKGYVYMKKTQFPHLLILDFVIQKQKDPASITNASQVALIKTLWYQSLYHNPTVQ